MSKSLLTQITNPVINPNLGSGAGEDGANAGMILARLVVIVWGMLLTLGGLAVIVFFIMGGWRWLSAGGDAKKVEDARNTITNALIGMCLLFASFAFANYIGPAIGFDLLKLNFLTPSDLGA